MPPEQIARRYKIFNNDIIKFSNLLLLLLLLYSLRVFHTIYNWCFFFLEFCKSPLVSRTLLNILVDFYCDILEYSFDLQSLLPLFQAFRDRSKDTNCNPYHYHFHVPLTISLWHAMKQFQVRVCLQQEEHIHHIIFVFSVILIIKGNGTNDQRSSLGRSCLRFTTH